MYKTRYYLYSSFHLSRIARITRLLSRPTSCFVIAFHGISRRKYENIPLGVQPFLTMENLRRIIYWLKRDFAFLMPEEFLNSTKKGVLLTFDDGFMNNYTCALPVLKEFKIPAIFFISTQHVINPRDWLSDTEITAQRFWEKKESIPDSIKTEFFDGMSKEQLLACAEDPFIMIGSHTVTHPLLTQCSMEKLQYELVTSKKFLSNLIGKKIDFFAYPKGDYNRRVAEMIRACGYKAAFAEDNYRIGLPILEIPRIGIYSANSMYLSIKLSGFHKLPKKIYQTVFCR